MIRESIQDSAPDSRGSAGLELEERPAPRPAGTERPSAATDTGVPNPVLSACLARPKHPALIAGDLCWSAADLAQAVRRFAGRMRAAGIEAGERVALCGPPSPSYAIAVHALGWLGATVVPLPPEAPLPELARALRAAGAARLLLSHGLTPEARDALRGLVPGAAFVNQLPLGEAPHERFWPLDEPRLVLFTSGSSGDPTPVELTTAQLLFSAFGSAVRLGHDPADRWLACLPFHHVGGLSILYRCAFYGITARIEPRFRPERVAQLLDAGEVSLVSLVPEMLRRVLDAREERPFPASLRAVLLGGDMAPEPLLERCRALRVPVALTWGMTETASQVATRAPGDLTPGIGCGAPLPFARVSVERGLLAVRGPLTRGEVTTRDLGAVDRWGRVHVEGRREEFVVSGGETISLREVERALLEHPDVADAVVLGVGDARWGERPVALVVPRLGSALAGEAGPEVLAGAGEAPAAAATLAAWTRARLGPIKTPDAWRFAERLPRSPLGKLARAEALRAFDRAPAAQAAEPGRAAASAAAPPDPPRRSPPAALQHLLGAAALHAPEGLRGKLDAVVSILGEDLLELEEGIEATASRLGGPGAPPAGRAARHLLERPGKRVRPLCALLAARAGDRPLDPAVQAVAVAAELVHAATLLHDDVIDEGRERRGAAAARVVFSNSASVLAGDFLFADALSRVAEADDGALLRGLLGVISEMVEAEALQLARREQLDPDPVAYLAILRGKTGALFRWVLSAGGRLGGLTSEAQAALARAGDALGLAFQLTDDVLDLEGDPATTGKDALADLRQGKLTWPFLVALERDPGLRAELEALIQAPDAGDPDAGDPDAGDPDPGDPDPREPDPGEELLAARVTAVVERVLAAGGVEATRRRAAEEGARALAELARLPACGPRWLLEAVVRAVVERAQ
ncbi:MAG: polyprenyl synthetase family protein [Planctomycetota bacterium]